MISEQVFFTIGIKIKAKKYWTYYRKVTQSCNFQLNVPSVASPVGVHTSCDRSGRHGSMATQEGSQEDPGREGVGHDPILHTVL